MHFTFSFCNYLARYLEAQHGHAKLSNINDGPPTVLNTRQTQTQMQMPMQMPEANINSHRPVNCPRIVENIKY